MKLLDKLTASPMQSYTVITDVGDQVTLDLRYLPTQQQWMASISWGSFVLNGITLTISPNILFGYKNVLPFGFMVTSTDNAIEPSYLDDFATGRIKMYVLSQADLDAQEALFEQ